MFSAKPNRDLCVETHFLFNRQLNLYGFRRITHGIDCGAYYHCLFLRGRPKLVSGMIRVKVKGNGTKAASNAGQEPNFYKMPHVGPARSYSHAMSYFPQRGMRTTFLPKSKTGEISRHHLYRPSPLRADCNTAVKVKNRKYASPLKAVDLNFLRNAFEPIQFQHSPLQSQTLENDQINISPPSHPLDQFPFMDFGTTGDATGLTSV